MIRYPPGAERFALACHLKAEARRRRPASWPRSMGERRRRPNSGATDGVQHRGVARGEKWYWRPGSGLAADNNQKRMTAKTSPNLVINSSFNYRVFVLAKVIRPKAIMFRASKPLEIQVFLQAVHEARASGAQITYKSCVNTARAGRALGSVSCIGRTPGSPRICKKAK
jgi:hypothetical protein